MRPPARRRARAAAELRTSESSRQAPTAPAGNLPGSYSLSRIPCFLSALPYGPGSLDDRQKIIRSQAGSAHQGAVDVGLFQQRLRVLGLDAASIENPRGGRDD